MTTEVKIDKGEYQFHYDMIKWLERTIGPGKWTYGTPETWEGLDGYSWAARQNFDAVTFAFKNDSDATLFILKWK